MEKNYKLMCNVRNNTETWNIIVWIMLPIKIAYLHHRVNVRSCRATPTERGSRGCTENHWMPASSSSQPALVSGPWGWRLAQIARLESISLGAGERHTGLPTPGHWICTEMSSRDSHMYSLCWKKLKQLQHISVKVINIFKKSLSSESRNGRFAHRIKQSTNQVPGLLIPQIRF